MKEDINVMNTLITKLVNAIQQNKKNETLIIYSCYDKYKESRI